MLKLISRVIERWSDHVEPLVIGGDFNASFRPSVGYVVGTETTQGPDSQLQPTGLVHVGMSLVCCTRVTSACHVVKCKCVAVCSPGLLLLADQDSTQNTA